MLNKKMYPVYLWLLLLLLISSCTDSSNLNEKTTINIESTYTPVSTKVEKSATEATISIPVSQEEMTTTPTFTAYSLEDSEWRPKWYWSQEYPLDELNLKIHDDYEEIQNIVFGDGKWLATLAAHNNYSESIHLYENLDREQIEELMLAGNKVKIICPGEGGWLVVTTKDNNYLDQKLIFSSEFNLDEIYEFIAEGYWVTELRYWENQWVVVLTETMDILDQKIEIVSDIGPARTYIDNTDSYLYTSIVFDGQQWFVVRSRLEEYRSQTLFINNVFPRDIIVQIGWFEGYDNIKMFYGNDQWICVFSK